MLPSGTTGAGVAVCSTLTPHRRKAGAAWASCFSGRALRPGGPVMDPMWKMSGRGEARPSPA
eukprot:1136867-Pelagomonas_calceolata.AAC.4